MVIGLFDQVSCRPFLTHLEVLEQLIYYLRQMLLLLAHLHGCALEDGPKTFCRMNHECHLFPLLLHKYNYAFDKYLLQVEVHMQP